MSALQRARAPSDTACQDDERELARATRTKGKLTVEELVDRHRPSDPGIRDLFVEYIRRRGAGMDYNSVNGIAHILVGTFWRTVEKVSPVRFTEETYQQWKEAVMVLPGGRRRLSIDAILIKIRSFYLDLQSWAHAEPERWGPWVAPCPVRETEVCWSHVNRRRLNERTADRTRVRQPLLIGDKTLGAR